MAEVICRNEGCKQQKCSLSLIFTYVDWAIGAGGGGASNFLIPSRNSPSPYLSTIYHLFKLVKASKYQSFKRNVLGIGMPTKSFLQSHF